MPRAPSPKGAAPREPPRLPRIRRRLLAVGIGALAMVAVAIAASLAQLGHDRHVRQQYEYTLAMTHLAFDAESLASRMRALQELVAQQAAQRAAGAANPLLRNALRSIDVDMAEWQRRIADAAERSLPPDAKAQLSQLQAAVSTMRAALGWSYEIAGGADAQPPGGPDAARARPRLDPDRAYLAAVEAAQATLLASVRAGADRPVIGGYTAAEIYSAIVIATSLLALLLGALVAALLNREQHETRATLGIMGELLRTDPLTGITNRRGLDENLPAEMSRSKRSATPLTVAMLDLDYFKRYNSRRGHAGGDSLLRIASQAWRKQLRPTDTLVRYGGEEFTLVLPSCDTEQACQLIARLRPLLPDNQTFSAGIATWDFQESGDELLQRADHALLAAKKQGRNRTIVAGREDQVSLPLAGHK